MIYNKNHTMYSLSHQTTWPASTAFKSANIKTLFQLHTPYFDHRKLFSTLKCKSGFFGSRGSFFGNFHLRRGLCCTSFTGNLSPNNVGGKTVKLFWTLGWAKTIQISIFMLFFYYCRSGFLRLKSIL